MVKRTMMNIISNQKIQTITLSIVVPVHNEEDGLQTLHKKLSHVLGKINCECEIIYVDDGSVDQSVMTIKNLPMLGTTHSLIKLSRNFGKEAAMTAGLKATKGRAAIIIDADLQDPPELIVDMVKKWEEGFDVVNLQRRSRNGETWFKEKSAAVFYKLLNKLSENPIPENVGDFRLISRRVIDEINQLTEKNIYMKGLFVWPGFKQTIIQFDREARFIGDSKWPYSKLFGLAVDGITSFSTKPLQIATYLGALIASSAFIYGLLIIAKTLIFGETVDGFPTIMLAILALGGFQLMSIGLIGAYVGRIYTEVKNRPRYIIEEKFESTSTLKNNLVVITNPKFKHRVEK